MASRLVVAGLVLACLLSGALGAATDRRPRLVVLLVIDQMRGDYLDRFGHQWTGGLRRLMDRGAVFRQALYPYLNTVTCAGHATLATGSFPATHGIILNQWWDRAAGRSLACIEDPAAPLLTTGTPLRGGASPVRLLVPTLADEMRTQLATAPRIVSLGGKHRSAVMMAGRRADFLAWFDPAARGWVTSSHYAPTMPPLLADFARMNSLDRDPALTWTRALPDSAYLFADDPDGRTPVRGVGAVFPHPLGHPSEQTFYQAWDDSPFADAALAKLAQTTLRSLQLGRGPGTDFLAVSFAGVDGVGHRYGPFSHEKQDALARVDREMGALLDQLDQQVGAGEYVVALSSDHGVSPIPEQAVKQGFDAGRIVSRPVREAVDAALKPFLGEGRHAAAYQNTQFYFQPGVYDQLRANPAALQAAIRALEQTPGVRTVLRSEDVERGTVADASLGRTARLSHFPGRSGDLVVIPKPYWITTAEAATHGTGYHYDAHVPVILMGKGIRPGEYFRPVTPADVAPTLAHLIGVTLARPDGAILREALVDD
jgi:predicted AlkP superfamily pyrophosphatase or phosphodiesterase